MPIVFINSATAYSDTAAQTLQSAAVNVAAGNLIAAVVHNYTNNQAYYCTGITDTAGNTYQRAGATYAYQSNAIHEIWYAYNTIGNASNRLTATWNSSATTYRRIIACQFSGATTDASVYDSAYNPVGGTDATSPYNSTAANTAADGELVFGYFEDEVSGGLSYSDSGNSHVIGTVGTDTTAAYQVCGTAGSYSAAIASGTSRTHSFLARAFKAAASGSPYSLSASSGSISETGGDSGLLSSRRADAFTGTLSETGATAALLSGRRLDAANGLLSETGQDVSLRKSWSLLMDTGSLTAVSQETALLRLSILPSGVGQYLVAGSDAQLGAAAVKVLVAASGNISEGGADAGLLKSSILDGDQSGLQAEGYAAILALFHVLTASGGTAQYSGSDVDLSRLAAHSMDADGGAVSFVSVDLALLVRRVIDCGGMACSWIGAPSTLQYSAVVIELPGGRIFVVAPDDRLQKISADRRIEDIPAESRSYVILN